MEKNVRTIVDAVENVDKEIEHIVNDTNKLVEPYRRSAFSRFPIIFALLVTFGAVATFFGFERLIMETPWLNDRPLLILGIGLATLVLTGTLYKKLG